MTHAFKPDDPRLTAYLLGELETDEARALETALREDESLRDALAQIRETLALIEDSGAFAAETPGLSAEQRARVQEPPVEINERPRGVVIRWRLWAPALAAAALLALTVGLGWFRAPETMAPAETATTAAADALRERLAASDDRIEEAEAPPLAAAKEDRDQAVAAPDPVTEAVKKSRPTLEIAARPPQDEAAALEKQEASATPPMEVLEKTVSREESRQAARLRPAVPPTPSRAAPTEPKPVQALADTSASESEAPIVGAEAGRTAQEADAEPTPIFEEAQAAAGAPTPQETVAEADTPQSTPEPRADFAAFLKEPWATAGKPGPKQTVAEAELLVRVMGPDGTPLPGATVTLIGPAMRQSLTANDERFVRFVGLEKLQSLTANDEGIAHFLQLEKGRYRIRAELRGFIAVVHSDFQLKGKAEKKLTMQVSLDPWDHVDMADIAEELVRTAETHYPNSSFSSFAFDSPGRQAPTSEPAPNVTKKARGERINRIASPSLAEAKRKKDLAESIGLSRAFSDEDDRGEGFNTEDYAKIDENEFISTLDDPLSTFSIDVDTASYANMRRFLRQGRRPPVDAIRIEELINYFSYDDPEPRGEHPFSINVEAAAAPWAPSHRLMRVGLQAKRIPADKRPPANLVFLLDVSGSMNSPHKLPLLKQALGMLVENLTKRDRVAIVVYAGAAGVVLEPTRGDNQQAIMEALERLRAGGSTNGAAGIERAYQLAADHFIKGGANRVILATDGDFNVGVADRGSLIRMIEQKAKTGVFLTVLGFGMGNLKDATLEQLANKGNGSYAYIDDEAEARKALVEEIGGALFTVAKDVKIQVEFNPLEVGAYRLIGYENRKLAHQDFNDDTKDAGEIGAGHSVTALYELIPAGAEDAPKVDALKYQAQTEATNAALSGELLTLKLRYKRPDEDTSRLLETPVREQGLDLGQASDNLRFAAAVAAFGMKLRDSQYVKDFDLEALLALARESQGADELGYRSELMDLIELARPLLKPDDTQR